MNIFSAVKSQISIMDVISHYATLKRIGNYYKGVCPFHSEKTASFTVTPSREIFYCFGCHATGDVIEFIAKIERCSPLEAVDLLVDKFGLTLPEGVERGKHHEKTVSYQERNRHSSLNDLVAAYCHTLLLKSPAVLQYLKERSISMSSIETFEIGYFPKGQQAVRALVEQAQQNAYLVDDLIKVGIIQESKGLLFSPFEQRIVFPIKDHLGRTHGFGARIFVKDDERVKYYNTRETDIFNKSQVLFGIHIAKPYVQKENHAFLVEGYFDCIALAQAGFKEAVATLGTACTIEQLRLISRYVNTVYVMYDGDKAGQAAMERLATLCWQVELELKIVILPEGEDPASYISKGNNIKKLIDTARDIFSFVIDRMSAGFSTKTVKEKIALVKDFVRIILRLDDPLKKELIMQQAAERFALPIELLYKELTRASGHQEATAQSHEPPSTTAETPEHQKVLEQLENVSQLEKKIFSVIINKGWFVTAEDAEIFFTEPVRTLYKKVMHNRATVNAQEVDQFEYLTSDERAIILKLVVHYYAQMDKDQFDQLWVQFQKKQWKSIVAETKQRLHEATQLQNTQAAETIIQNFQELRRSFLRKGLL